MTNTINKTSIVFCNLDNGMFYSVFCLQFSFQSNFTEFSLQNAPLALIPPSTGSSIPVMKLELSFAKNAMAFTQSFA